MSKVLNHLSCKDGCSAQDARANIQLTTGLCVYEPMLHPESLNEMRSRDSKSESIAQLKKRVAIRL